MEGKQRNKQKENADPTLLALNELPVGTYRCKYRTLPADWTGIGALKEGASSADNGVNINAFSGTFDSSGKTLTVPEGGKAPHV